MNEDITSQKTDKHEGHLSFFLEILKIVVLALIIILPIRYYIAQPFFVKGASMEPSFEDGDYLIIDEISYRFSGPQRTDVIVFRFPEDPSQFFIKRIIGLPGETIQIKKREITILNKENKNGFIIDESGYLDPGQATDGDLRVELSSNEYFVLGDNRLHSSDSRRWGTLERKLITGKVFLRAWPLNKIDLFSPAVYPSN